LQREIVITPPRRALFGALGQLRALPGYGDLLYVLTLHRIRVRYKQSLLGPIWAVLQPLLLMLIFTVLFALARTVGWIAQWKEMIEDPNQKIGRPRQLYTGATRRNYLPLSRRK